LSSHAASAYQIAFRLGKYGVALPAALTLNSLPSATSPPGHPR